MSYFVHRCSVTQSCLTRCDPMDCSPQGSSIHGIFQVRILEWLPFPPPGDLHDAGIKPASLVSLTLQVDYLSAEPSGKPSLRFSKFSVTTDIQKVPMQMLLQAIAEENPADPHLI